MIISHLKKPLLVLIITGMLFGGIAIYSPQANAQSNREQLLLQIEQLIQMISLLQAQLEVRRGSEVKTVQSVTASDQVKIGSFTHTIPTLDDPASLQWTTVGMKNCSIYHADVRRGLVEEDVGLSGERQVALSFKRGSKLVRFELRCQPKNDQLIEQVSAFTEIHQDDLELFSEEVAEELRKGYEEAFSIDYQSRADEEIESAERELQYQTERLEENRSRAEEVGLIDEINTLLSEVEEHLLGAQAAYDDEEYETVIELVESADEELDEVNELIDDIEDGRV